MPSRRRRLAMLRVFGSTPEHATDEPNGPGMDALHDASDDAARPRSAPAFCEPRPVAPKPYQPVKGAAPRPVITPKPVIRPKPAPPRRVEPPVTVAASIYEFPRRTPEPAVDRPGGSVRPIWDDGPEESEAEVREERTEGPAWTALARGVALFFGTLLAIDLFAKGGLPEAGPWWLDTRPLPTQVAKGLLGLGAAVLVAFGVRPALPRPVRAVATLCLVLLMALALKNGTVYYGLLKRGDLHAGPPVAFPLHVAACLGVVLIAMRSAPRAGGFRDLVLAMVGFNGALVALPVAQIACCGPVDARRPAAAVVVMEPRTFEKDVESQLDERMRTAVELYEKGLVPKVVLAAGPEERIERLKKIAAEGGVSRSAISVLAASDEKGMVAELGRTFGATDGEKPTLLAVSGFDHLPRVGLVARRAGIDLHGVPVESSERPKGEVVVREVVELWRVYFGR